MKQDVTTKEIKRYHLALAAGQYEALQEVANRRQTTIVEVLRQFIKIGLLVDRVNDSENAKILIRENNADREIVFM